MYAFKYAVKNATLEEVKAIHSVAIISWHLNNYSYTTH